LDQKRKENLDRMASSGPSNTYGQKINSRIKPNINFTGEIKGNPSAEVEVRLSPDGTIVSRKLLTSSGNTDWDNAVLKAVDKTQQLPRDVDGKVYPRLVINFRPKDISANESVNQGMAEGNRKSEPPEADYGADYQDMVKRVKKLAGVGPSKTQYDPARRVYRNMPTAVQPKK